MRIFIFDLDGTLGKKTPSYPDISPINAKFLRKLSSSEKNILIFATGRPRTQAFLGLAKGGLSESESKNIFFGRIFEDGLLVETKSRVIYNALEDSSSLFKKIKISFFDSQAQSMFNKHGFFLVPGKIIRQCGVGFQILDYQEKLLGKINVPAGLIPLYQQGNDVRETYKLPQKFEDDDLQKQTPFFKKIFTITKQYLNERFPKWEESTELVTWQDSVEIYPRINKEEVFIKWKGLEKLFNKLGIWSNAYIYLCCDGRNDISLVKGVAEKSNKYKVICPENLSKELKDFLIFGKFEHIILKEDCTEFAKGLQSVIT